jgi:hypothetical protein
MTIQFQYNSLNLASSTQLLVQVLLVQVLNFWYKLRVQYGVWYKQRYTSMYALRIECNYRSGKQLKGTRWSCACRGMTTFILGNSVIELAKTVRV